MKKIALISTPWPLFNRPSIQLGCLKAFLKKKLPDLHIDAFYVYLNIAYRIGYELYSKISESSWLSEPIYAALLYPDKIEDIQRFWYRQAHRLLKKDINFFKLCELVKVESEVFLDKIRWDNYLLIGFSICFSQLTSSIYFIKEIKKRAPNIKIAVGGSSCAKEMGVSLLNTFDEIDFVIQGEGELPLFYLVDSIIKEKELFYYPGLLSRKWRKTDVSQIKNLDELPVPDYSDYFLQARQISLKRPFQAKLPMEMSRGCWWRRCRFCNLNIQWKGYRAKSPERISEEINELIEKYQILSISFTDNLLPPKMESIFKNICELKKDLKLFAEIRADTPLSSLILMAAAGMNEVQVGIEALSTKLLKKMNKGVTAIQNIEIMKNCEAKGMPKLVGNMILEFPGSDEEDVKETLKNLDFVFPFRPLKGIPFWLGYSSFVWKNPASFFIKKTGNHRNYLYIFPKDILKQLTLMIQGYRGELRNQRRLWRPVRDKIKEWVKFYSEIHSDYKSEPILSYQDGGDFLIIRQRIHKQHNMVHKLKGMSRKIFLFCEKNRSFYEIKEHFSHIDPLALHSFLRMMVEKRLMFNEDNRYLSLAVPVKGWNLNTHV